MIYVYNLSCSLTAEVTVPGLHACDVMITAHQLIIDVPYSATVTAQFEDGSTRV